ncbi:RNA polymerase sigma factor [Demequina mangrovi]|uniref:RNA polymerase sigma factor, sigma-70 family n=1 Tax=Demequina mangrovi TaxID=1043493 RepID=A0A1H7AH38_9MICO|nr:sigma-70 family RNA polymerase sigma factor [Demequina mangrovi]SEJ63207.1 RNA polymerase sigma factor, sigma-70 family [Demequina mangrovi]
MSGWRDALDVLMRERGRALFGYAYMLAGSREDAEDLLQEALVRTFRTARPVRDVDAAHAYVKRAIATASIDRSRRDHARPRIVDADLDALRVRGARMVSPDHSGLVDAAIDLRAALLTLSPRERACVVLRYLEGMPVAEVARTLGLAQGTVKRYLSDGIVKLRGALPELDLDEPETVPVQAPSGGV